MCRTQIFGLSTMVLGIVILSLNNWLTMLGYLFERLLSKDNLVAHACVVAWIQCQCCGSIYIPGTVTYNTFNLDNFQLQENVRRLLPTMPNMASGL